LGRSAGPPAQLREYRRWADNFEGFVERRRFEPFFGLAAFREVGRAIM
jgi:hypothetical protein